MTLKFALFEPNSLVLKKGEPVKFVLTSSDFGHTFTIARNTNRTGVVEGLVADILVSGGQTISTQALTPQEAGTFFLYCRFHWQSGMTGTIQVTNGNPGEEATPTPTATLIPIPPSGMPYG